MRVITVSEIEAMTPAERVRSFTDAVVHDLDQVPAEYRPVLEAQQQRVLERENRLRSNAF